MDRRKLRAMRRLLLSEALIKTAGILDLFHKKKKGDKKKSVDDEETSVSNELGKLIRTIVTIYSLAAPGYSLLDPSRRSYVLEPLQRAKYEEYMSRPGFFASDEDRMRHALRTMALYLMAIGDITGRMYAMPIRDIIKWYKSLD